VLRLLPPTGPLDDDELVAAYAPQRPGPSLRVNFVTSLDGAAQVDGYSRGLSSDADRMVFHVLRRHTDAVLVGAGTLRHEGYGPARMKPEEQQWRVDRGLAPHPTLVIVSSTLDLDPNHPSLAEAPVRPIVLTHAGTDPDRRQALSATADVVVCGESAVDLSTGVADLHRRGLNAILCEGGPHLFGTLLAADLVDELCLTVSPLLAGPGSGRIIAGATGPAPRDFRAAQIIEADGNLFLRYTRS
jgi:riboflavin biosynthesis pyrimidine reductase